jgi:hypothetical protein
LVVYNTFSIWDVTVSFSIDAMTGSAPTIAGCAWPNPSTSAGYTGGAGDSYTRKPVHTNPGVDMTLRAAGAAVLGTAWRWSEELGSLECTAL